MRSPPSLSRSLDPAPSHMHTRQSSGTHTEHHVPCCRTTTNDRTFYRGFREAMRAMTTTIKMHTEHTHTNTRVKIWTDGGRWRSGGRGRKRARTKIATKCHDRRVWESNSDGTVRNADVTSRTAPTSSVRINNNNENSRKGKNSNYYVYPYDIDGGSDAPMSTVDINSTTPAAALPYQRDDVKIYPLAEIRMADTVDSLILV